VCDSILVTADQLYHIECELDEVSGLIAQGCPEKAMALLDHIQRELEAIRVDRTTARVVGVVVLPELGPAADPGASTEVASRASVDLMAV
jgi:hypothetical protein